jgi:hypothetical protein
MQKTASVAVRTYEQRPEDGIDQPSTSTNLPRMSVDRRLSSVDQRRDSVTHVYDDIDWGQLQVGSSDNTPRGARNLGGRSRANTAVVTDFTKQDFGHRTSTSSTSRAFPTTAERRSSGNGVPSLGPRGSINGPNTMSGSGSASAGTGSAGSSRPGSALGSSRQARSRGARNATLQPSPTRTASISEVSDFPSGVSAGASGTSSKRPEVRQKSATAKRGGREKVPARGIRSLSLPLDRLNAQRDSEISHGDSRQTTDTTRQTTDTTDEVVKMPAPPVHMGLASELSGFALPPAPTFATISAAMLAETREELDMLAKAAECAAST